MRLTHKPKTKVNEISESDLVALYKNYVIRIYRYMYVRVRRKELAEDLAGVCIVKIVKNKHKIREKGNINAWIFTIAHNVLVDYYRGTRKFDDLDIHENDIVTESHASEDIEKELMIKEVLGSLDRLNPSEREIIELTYLAGLEASEIAEIVEKPYTTIRTIRHRAIKKLRKLLILE